MAHEGPGAIAVTYRPGASLDAPESGYAGFAPGQSVIKAGTIVKEGALPIPYDLILDRDVEVPLRDGTVIYTDVYRPADATGPLPAIIGWSPYGKRDGFITFDNFPFRAGVPQRLISGLDKFEGPDPAWWCPRGYAIVSPDVRGAYKSGGKMRVWDQQEGRDGADLVEWVAAQDWCTSKVGMAGTSWLGIGQWFTAAERPEHLAAIAPWEGMDDAYRFCFGDGGMPYSGFAAWLMGPAASENGIEDIPAMLEQHPDYDDYWTAKRAAVEQIETPAYVAMSWGGKLHCRGAFEGWHRLQSQDRWLRIYNDLEWPDFYDNAYQEDLRRFFDHFLHGKENGWRDTPPVRMTVCDFAHRDLVDRAEESFPLARVVEHDFHLGADNTLGTAGAPSAGTVAYDAETGESVFELTFTEPSEINGYAQLRLFLEADGSNDADIFVKLEKAGPDGKVQGSVLLPQDEPENAAMWDDIVEFAEGLGRSGFLYDGPWARMRASRRAMSDDPREEPRYAKEDLLAPGQVVEVVLTLAPTAMIVHPGETLRLRISGANLTPFAFPGAQPLELRNAGRHIIHTGGAQASRLTLPLV